MCFYTLDEYRKLNKNAMPKPWDLINMVQFEELGVKLAKDFIEKPEEDEKYKTLLQKFALSCDTSFPPLAAFMGGYIS